MPSCSPLIHCCPKGTQKPRSRNRVVNQAMKLCVQGMIDLDEAREIASPARILSRSGVIGLIDEECWAPVALTLATPSYSRARDFSLYAPGFNWCVGGK